MSAYLTDPDKIHALAYYADQHECCKYGEFYGLEQTASATGIAQVLARENIRSVRARYDSAAPYSDSDDCQYFDGWSYGDYINECAYNSARAVSPTDIVELVKEYRYQSCETDDFTRSLAYCVLCAIMWHIAEQAHNREQYGWHGAIS